MRWTFWRRRTADDFSNEVDAHLAMETERLVRSGMSPDDAAFAARRAFGNVTATREQFHEARTSARFERLVLDVRYTLRGMRRAPGFTAVAVLSLALGIGASAAIFSTINELLLKNLPVADPDRLVMLRADDTAAGGEWGYASFSYDLYRNLREQARGFSDIVAIGVLDRFNVSLGGPGGGLDPARTRVAIVSGNYFSVLGIGAARGRAITPADDRVPGRHPVAVMSDGYRRRRFAPSDDPIGRTLAFNGTTYDVIGVMPASFSGDWVGRPIDIWVPMMMEAQVMTERPGLENANFLRIIGRLSPGVSLQQAERDAGQLVKRLRDEKIGPRRLSLVERFGLAPAGGGYSPQRESYGTSLLILAVAVALVLLIACANVANLLLARSEARQREMALRLAIGAGAGRIARQVITESVVLGVIGGALGVLLSVWVTGVVGSVIGGSPIPVDSRNAAQPLTLSLHPDARVLAFAAGLSVLTAIAFGLAPALRAASVSIASLTSRGEASSGTGRRHPLSRLLVVLQVALSLPLLISAGLFARSMHNLRSVDLGFDRQHTLLVWTSPGQTTRQGSQLAAFAHTVVARVSALPGVLSASVASNGVLTGISDQSGGRSENAKAEGVTPKPGVLGISLVVSPKYFETLGLHLVEGRLFTDADGAGPPRVAVVNETMRRALFGDVDPIGRHYYLLPRDAAAQTQVIGVVSDVKWGSPRDRARMIEYVPVSQASAQLNNMVVLVRAVGAAETVASRVRSELAAIDPGLPVIGLDTLEQQLDDVLAQDRLLAGLAVAAGLVVAILTCLGLYGVISYVTARRTREIGIRVALGATRSGVIAMVIGESGKLVIAGIVLGVPLTLALTRYASSRLYNVSAGDPVYVAAAIALMLAVAFVASLLPAWRTSRVDPMDALRAE